MAGLTCQCGEALSVHDLICMACGTPVFRAPPPPPQPQPRAQASTEPLAADSPEPPIAVCTQPWCRREYPVGMAACPACGEPAAAAPAVALARLRLAPGLEIGLRPGEALILGRECPDARVAHHLDQYDGVSRRHLEVVVTQQVVTVADLGSLNGTVVDGSPIETPTALGAGSHDVRLGRYAEVALDVVGSHSP